jgi:flagellar basal-body rod protein FlgG
MTNAALHVARTGLDAQSARMRVIANNLANVNTTGFKRDRASFETLAYQALTSPGAASAAENKYATGTNLGSGVQINGTSRIDTQGSTQATGNALDMAIEGSGYFQIQTPAGRSATPAPATSTCRPRARSSRPTACP